MFKTRYLIRLDDACPYMDRAKWQRMEDILDKYCVKPLVGIIPANADPQTMIESEDAQFWDKAKLWQKKGWSLALHGYDHCYISDKGMKGLNPLWERSEFSGVAVEVQRKKMSNGIAILKEKGLVVKHFFAPSHTFDNNTIEALKSETDIRIVSDTIGRYPYRDGVFWFIPQIFGHCVNIPIPGIYTFCFHPNTMTDTSFETLERFLKKHSNKFISFDEIELTRYKKKKLFDKFLSWLFFKYRSLKGLR